MCSVRLAVFAFEPAVGPMITPLLLALLRLCGPYSSLQLPSLLRLFAIVIGCPAVILLVTYLQNDLPQRG